MLPKIKIASFEAQGEYKCELFIENNSIYYYGYDFEAKRPNEKKKLITLKKLESLL